MKYLLPILIFAMLLVACGARLATGTPAPDSPVSSSDTPTNDPTKEPSALPYAPQPDDVKLSRETIYIEEKGY